MIDLDSSTREGHYAQKQLLCESRLISWSHEGRFRMGLELAAEIGGDRLLDHGCGDGTFLAIHQSGSSPAKHAVGSEISPALVADCQRRFAERSGLDFVLTSELAADQHQNAYDLIVCMEVLEHVTDLPYELDRIWGLLAPSGRLLVSVPVEIGPTLIVKQITRRIAGWRKLGHYPGTTSYTLSELVKSLVAGDDQHIARPVFLDSEDRKFHDHKGFNYRVLQKLIEERFELERMVSSPISWLPTRLASQVWFIARKRENAAA